LRENYSLSLGYTTLLKAK